MRYEDRGKLDHTFTSSLRKLRALVVHVTHWTKPEAIILKPVLDGVYVNNKGAHSVTIIVMIVSDRLESWTVYRKIAKHLSALLYEYWKYIGYADGTIRSPMDDLV